MTTTPTDKPGESVPFTSRDCAEALWPKERLKLTRTERGHTLGFTMGNAPAPVREALRAILPANAKQVQVIIDWEGDAPTTIF